MSAPLSLVPREQLFSGAEFRSLTKGMRFVRFFNADRTHRGFTWELGENVLKEPFYPHDTCEPGGLYFSTIHHVCDWFDSHTFIGQVTIPDDAQVWTECGRKYKSDIVVVENMISIAELLSEIVYIDDQTKQIWLKRVSASTDRNHSIFAIFCDEHGQICYDKINERIKRVLRRICKKDTSHESIKWIMKPRPNDLDQYELIISLTLANLVDVLNKTPDSDALIRNVKKLYDRIASSDEPQLFKTLVECRYDHLIDLDSATERFKYIQKFIDISNMSLLRALRGSRIVPFLLD